MTGLPTVNPDATVVPMKKTWSIELDGITLADAPTGTLPQAQAAAEKFLRTTGDVFTVRRNGFTVTAAYYDGTSLTATLAPQES